MILNESVLTEPQWLGTMVVTKKGAQKQYLCCINFSDSCGNNQSHVHPPRRSTKKETQKSPTAWSATKHSTRHEKSGHCTRPEKPGRYARHMNENNRQTNDGRKGKPINDRL